MTSFYNASKINLLIKYTTILQNSYLKPEADPDPNQRGGRRGAEIISGGAETISGGQEGGQVIFEGGLVPPLAPPWIRHYLKLCHQGETRIWGLGPME